MPSESMPTSTTEESQSALGGLARLIWMTVGNIALVVLALGIAMGPPWSFTWRDWAFLAAAGGMLLVRYVDITRLGGRTAEGDPATTRDFRSWAAGVLVACAVAWGLAHSFAL